MPHNVVTLKQHPGLTLASGQPKFVPDMATPVEIMTNAQRLALETAPFGLVVIESDTISDNKAYIGTGNGTNWLGPFTAAQVGLGGGGSSGTSTESEVVDNTGNFIYEGYAPFGSATSAAAWKIFRTPVSGSVTGPTQRADSNSNYDNVWDNRAALSYT